VPTYILGDINYYTETVDATDYYDGFGTGEIVIGIRAYQWGWEYFYPKNIDLNYNVKPSYSNFIGNSLKYTNTSSEVLKSNSLWKFYQNNSSNNLFLTPASTILSPNDTLNNLNLISFSNIGVDTLSDSTAFKKIQNFSKLTPQFIHLQPNSYFSKFDKINNLYLNEFSLDNINSPLSITRQHNYTSLKTSLNTFTTLIDNSSFKKFFMYTNNTSHKKPVNSVNYKLDNPYRAENFFSNSGKPISEVLGLVDHSVNSLAFSRFVNYNSFIYQTEHFINGGNMYTNYLPSNKLNSFFIDKLGAIKKNFDFSNNFSTNISSSTLNSNSNEIFKSSNLKSGGQVLSSQDKSLREFNKNNLNSSLQDNASTTNKLVFSNHQNLPLSNNTTFNSSHLG